MLICKKKTLSCHARPHLMLVVQPPLPIPPTFKQVASSHLNNNEPLKDSSTLSESCSFLVGAPKKKNNNSTAGVSQVTFKGPILAHVTKGQLMISSGRMNQFIHFF